MYLSLYCKENIIVDKHGGSQRVNYCKIILVHGQYFCKTEFVSFLSVSKNDCRLGDRPLYMPHVLLVSSTSASPQ